MQQNSMCVALLVSALLASGPAFAQGDTQQGQSDASSQSAEQGKAMKFLPEACRKAAQDSHMGQMMQTMPMTQGNMPMDHMSESNRAYFDAMRDMNPPMMLGMTISDPDLAFICSMIPHHQGAVDMAKAALKSAKDGDVRRMAERTIKEQEKEIEEMKHMAEKHGK